MNSLNGRKMLFAPVELNLYLRWQIASERFWQERYDEWLTEQRARPELLKAYLRYKEAMRKIECMEFMKEQAFGL